MRTQYWTPAVIVLAACGSHSPAAVTNASAGANPSAAAVSPLPPPPVCDARMDMPDGFHDRYMFQDAATEMSGFKTKSGKVVIPALYGYVYPFTPGGVAAVVDRKTPFVFIDVDGNVIAKAFAYDNGPDYYQEGFARVVGADGKLGFISETSGKIEILPQFDHAAPFCEGKAEVEVGGQTFGIDKRGQRVP